MDKLVHKLYSLKDFDLKNKKVFVRTDFNVPVLNDQVTDHIRLQSALPTLSYVLKKGGKLILGSHRGRPHRGKPKLTSDLLLKTRAKKQATPQSLKNLSLEPLGAYLSQHLNCEVLFIKDLTQTPSLLFSSLNEKKIILLENLRFYTEEETGDTPWAKALSRSIDIYINEAFSVSHRNHTSITLLPQKIKQRGMGLSLKKEIDTLNFLRESSPAPFMLLAGGVKVSDKIHTLIRLMDRVDCFLIGGLMAYTFLKAKGVETGEAFIEKDSLKLVSDFIEKLKVRKKSLFLPIDHVMVPHKEEMTKNQAKKAKVTEGEVLPKGFLPLDIGPKTIKCFSKVLQSAGTVFWNGPMGRFEDPLFAKGTLSMCEAINNCKNAFKAVGGGDSISALLLMNQQKSFDYISTGGGACLKYLEQGQLPGIQSLFMRIRYDMDHRR